jgi:hypothetical protein
MISPEWKAVKTEPEGLLEAVAREWPVKTQQTGKTFSRCCGDL